MESFIVTIDNEENILSYVGKSHGGFAYNTIGNKSAHTFKYKLIEHTTITTNGHKYQIFDKVR